MALPPGCVRIKFAFGVHGLDMKADEVVSVIDGTQAAYAGVKPQWKLLMIDGEEMVDETLIRPALMISPCQLGNISKMEIGNKSASVTGGHARQKVTVLHRRSLQYLSGQVGTKGLLSAIVANCYHDRNLFYAQHHCANE